MCAGISSRHEDTLRICRIDDDDTIHTLCHYHEGFTQVFLPPRFANNGSGASSGQTWRNKIWILDGNRMKIKFQKHIYIGIIKEIHSKGRTMKPSTLTSSSLPTSDTASSIGSLTHKKIFVTRWQTQSKRSCGQTLANHKCQDALI